MARLYILVVVIGMLGIVGYGAKYYYDTTQATIRTLQSNNAKLETAIETSEASIAALQQSAEVAAREMNELTGRLQKAEQYGDSLRNKLRELDLVQDALTDPKDLEGRMNRATAKIWRRIMDDTGGDGSKPFPDWLQQVPTGTGDQGSDAGGADNSSTSSETQATPTS